MIRVKPDGYIVLYALFVFCLAESPAQELNTRHYLLITSNDLASAFQPLVDRRISQGFSGNLITVETIDSTYHGIDIQEKIRNCIKDHYDPNVSLFVALGGDAIIGDVQNSIVPVRYCKPVADTEPVPTDMYYADIDGGSWDKDQDGLYGEVEDITIAELTQEVYLGRIPVRMSEEARVYIDKVIRYEEAPTKDFSNSMIILGKTSSKRRNPTGDKRPMDMRDHDPVSCADRDWMVQYTQSIQPFWRAVPFHLFVDTKSPWDEFFCGDYDLTDEHVVEQLNQANRGKGYHFIIHGAHSNAGVLGLEGHGLTIEGVYHLKHDIPSVVISGGCAAAYFDGTRRCEPCIAEALIRHPYGGAVVYFGWTRSHTGGPNIIKPIFEEKALYFGKALALAKMEVASFFTDDPRNDYLYILLGDPAIKMLDVESERKVQVFQPKGCEVIQQGSDLYIRWNAVGTDFEPDEKIKLEWSDDSGRTWHAVPGAEQLLHNGYLFIWRHCPLPSGNHYRIRITSLANSNVSHYSERDFTITELGLLSIRSYPFNGVRVNGTHGNLTNYTHSVKVEGTVSLIVPEYTQDLSFAGWFDSYGSILSADATHSFVFTEDITVIAMYGHDYVGPITHYYVNDEASEQDFCAGSDLNDGLTIQTPKRHIRSLLEDYRQIGRGAVICVSEGYYPENITLDEGNSGLTLIGAGADLTVLDGQDSDSCLKLEHCVGCNIQGLKLTNGFADDGGGIYCRHSSPTIIDCVITGNSGRGVYCRNSTIMLAYCTLSDNVGSGLYNYVSNAVIEKCTFSRNSVTSGGGGVRNYNCDPIFRNCIFLDNVADNRGGGMSNHARSKPVLYNCTFVGNSAPHGGAVCSITDSEATLVNCILWDNLDSEIHGAAIVTYSDVQGGWPGEGNINVDPLFLSSYRGDFHLKSEAGHWDPGSEGWEEDPMTSPCIDAGDPNSDWTEEPWPNGERINMGAYGGTAEASKSIQ